MLKHVVFFKLQDPTEETLNKTRDILLSMKGRVAEVINIEVGIDILKSPRSYDVCLIVELDDMDALARYHHDEYHNKVVNAYLNTVISSSAAVDYII
ncbi:MAG: Dabb family protein [Clostridiales bacterium]|nr:Dabb family protein [Clostridiales bacterium]